MVECIKNDTVPCVLSDISYTLPGDLPIARALAVSIKLYLIFPPERAIIIGFYSLDFQKVDSKQVNSKLLSCLHTVRLVLRLLYSYDIRLWR